MVAYKKGHDKDQEHRLRAVLGDIISTKNLDALLRYITYFDQDFSLPWEVKERNASNPKKLTLIHISLPKDEVLDEQGLLGELKDQKGKKIVMPLCNLRSSGLKSKNHQILEDYCDWFSAKT
jgi:hypothetical protein